MKATNGLNRVGGRYSGGGCQSEARRQNSTTGLTRSAICQLIWAKNSGDWIVPQSPPVGIR